MYGPRPIRFPAHWCADYSKYQGFLAGGISTVSSLIPFVGTRLHPHNTASYAGYPGRDSMSEIGLVQAVMKQVDKISKSNA